MNKSRHWCRHTDYWGPTRYNEETKQKYNPRLKYEELTEKEKTEWADTLCPKYLCKDECSQ